MKKFGTQLVSILFVLVFSIGSAFAADTSKKFEYALTVDGEKQISVKIGSEFTVQLVLRRTDKNTSGRYAMYTAEDYIVYDISYVKPILSEIDMEESGFKLIKQDISDGEYTKFRVKFSSSSKNSGESKSDELLVLTVTFQANKIGKTIIKSDNYKVLTSNGDNYSCVARNLTVNVVAKSDTSTDTIDTSEGTDFSFDAKTLITNDSEMNASFTEKITEKILEKVPSASSLKFNAKHIGTETVKKVLFELEPTVIKAISQTILGASISTPLAGIKFDNTWLRSISDKMLYQDEPVTFSVYKISRDILNVDQRSKIDKESAVYGMSIFSGVKPINADNGNAEITLKSPLDKSSYSDNLTIYLLNEDGIFTKIPCTYDKKAETVTFTTKSAGVFAIVTDKLAKFADVSKGDWFYNSVSYAIEESLFNGTTEDMFDPSSSMTRAMMVTVLYRFAGEPRVKGQNTFTDVANDAWYANAIVWAYENEIVSGYSDGSFAPNESINREQVASILHRYISKKSKKFTLDETTKLNFSDVGEISEYANLSIKFCVSNGIISGRANGTFAPKSYVTRAEVATILMRLSEKL